MPRGYRADGKPSGRPKGSKVIDGKLYTAEQLAERAQAAAFLGLELMEAQMAKVEATATGAKQQRSRAQLEALARGRAKRHAQMRAKAAEARRAQTATVEGTKRRAGVSHEKWERMRQVVSESKGFVASPTAPPPAKRRTRNKKESYAPKLTIIGNAIDFSRMPVGQRIRWVREALIMTLGDLAERVGMNESSLSQLELGYTQYSNPSSTTIQRLAAGLGVDALWLAYGVGEINPTRRNAQAAITAAQRIAIERAMSCESGD